VCDQASVEGSGRTCVGDGTRLRGVNFFLILRSYKGIKGGFGDSGR
jgi:hypothetical protein